MIATPHSAPLGQRDLCDLFSNTDDTDDTDKKNSPTEKSVGLLC